MSSAPDEHSGECPNYETFQDRLNRQQIEITRLQTELAEARKDNDRLAHELTSWRYGHGEIEAACGGEIAQAVRADVMKRRVKIDAMKATPQ